MKTILQAQKFTDKERIIFYRQLAIILHSGLPILTGIKLMNQRVDKKLKVVCNFIYNDLTRGCSLAASMRKQKYLFHDLGIMLIGAGEESGKLEEIANELANFYEKQYSLKKSIFKAALYPMFLISTAICVFIFFIFYVLPILATTYNSMKIQPVGFLAKLLEMQTFVRTHTQIVLLMLVFIILSVYQCRKNVFNLLKNAPFLGKLYYLTLEIRFCKLMALLLNSGMSVTSAVSIATKTIDDAKCQRKLQIFQDRLKNGADISSASEVLAGWISPLAMDFITIGAITGYLPNMLDEVACIGEQDLQNGLDRLKEIISPLLLLFATLITVGTISSVIGPLFNLISKLPENL